MKFLVILLILSLAIAFPVNNYGSLSTVSNGLFEAPPSLFFDLVISSLKIELLSKFFEQVLTDVSFVAFLNDVNKIAAANEAQMEAVAKLLEEPDYSYTNVYDCSKMTINTQDDIQNAPYGCHYEASVIFTVNLGNTAKTNMSATLNDMTSYNKQYTAYLKSMQDAVFSDWGKWYSSSNGRAFYSCSTGSTIDKCESTPFTYYNAHSDATYGDPNINVKNAFIGGDKTSSACTSMSQYYNITFDPTDLDYITYQVAMPASDKADESKDYTITNTTAPKIMSLIPNPMANMTTDNITDIGNLINFLDNNLFNEPGCDLFDLLSPLQVFISASESVTTIKIDGQKEVEEEKKEREMMILSIVLGILGVFSMVLGPEMTIALESAVATAGIVGTWAIEGHITAGDVILNLVGVIAGGLRGIASGLKFGEVINAFKFTRNLSSYTGLMRHFPHYAETMSTLFGMSFNPPS